MKKQNIGENIKYWRQKLGGIMFSPQRIQRFYRRLMPNKGVYIMSEDWDNLIVLDACRYDTFKEVTGINNLDYRISRGSSTPEFLKENFAGRKFIDTVVISANPYIERLVRNSFYKVISVWEHGWDNRCNTVLPQTILEYGKRVATEYPDKRLIVWFVQPHQPFIENPEFYPYGFKHACEITKFGRSETPPLRNLWVEAAKGDLDIRRVWEGYRRNLEIVVPYALELASNLKGKTVITADHGSTFKRLVFPIPFWVTGHTDGIHILDLIKVPWLVFQNSERKRIREGTNVGKETIKAKVEKLKRSGRLEKSL